MTQSSFERLEKAYEAMAHAIDQAGPEREALFLAKLALTLAHRIDNDQTVAACISIALADLQLGERRADPQ